MRLVLAGLCLLALPASADNAVVAVAANFAEVMEQLEADFERRFEHTLDMTTGSTGALYAQARAGAPFDVLLAADQRRPKLLEEEGIAAPKSRFTYAIGRLVLWSANPDRVAADGRETLAAGAFRKLAIANPRLAPYGEAARQTLVALDLYDAVESKLVMGTNIGQTHAMVATGSAELGFVALSHVLSRRNQISGSHWEVPADLYSPIRQDAVLLSPDNPAANAFHIYLGGESARVIIERFGYFTD